MSIAGSLKEKYNSEYQKGLLEKWKPNINAVKSVYPGFSNISAINLAIVCENTDAKIKKYQRMHEGTQASDVGPYIRHAFELITGVMPNLVAEEVVSVQALDNKIGQIFFMRYVYGSNKGNVQKGTEAMGPYNIASNPDYTSEHIPQELISAGDTAHIQASLAWGPVLAGSVTVTAGALTLHDDGKGKILNGTTEVGTIDYASGAIDITLGSAPDADVNVEYDYSLEYAPTAAPQFDMTIEERVVMAKPRRLRTNYAFAAAYDVEKQFGIDMDEELLTASITEIKHEIDQEILGDLYRQAGLTHTWNMTDRYAISKKQHYESFAIALNEGCNLIRKETKRVAGNTVVTGINGLNVIESFDGFIPSNASDKVGAYVAGTIKGRIKVIANPFYGDDQYLIAYKGDNFLDAGYVYAPYLPVFATSVIMLDDFVGRRGYATSYAKAMLNRTYYVKGTITHNPEPVSNNVTIVGSAAGTALDVQVTNDQESPVYTQEVPGV